jgi:hypothetical protein
MRAVRRRLRLYVWLALLSITALAICPTVSRMVLPDGFVQYDHVAQASGDTRAVATAELPHEAGAAHDHRHHHVGTVETVPMPVSTHPPSHHHTLEHCGFCVLAAHAFAVAPVAAEVLVSSDCGRRPYNRGVLTVPRLRCDWSPGSSRGPPLYS